ncbi:MAG: 2-C-methyl-D-erythritol 4-phosphate cytidylyltransferase [Clostridia bacterium]|jgi:2-C-methyl-D-erythritol 4-phosphate cytidylyltransferase|nr:2-C-methyl-D-erythritol 4-phosphate cytidylyltransferase [Clostridia bacterium]
MMRLAKVVALLPSAGQGTRMGAGVKKPYLEVHGRPLLTYTLDVFEQHPLIDGMVIVTEAEYVSYTQREIVEKYGYTKVLAVTAGGRERQDSVLCGLKILPEETQWVAVHDGARPLVSAGIISRVLEEAWAKGSAVAGVRVKDTIKKVGGDLSITETPERRLLWQIQTPQVFRRELLVQAYERAAAEGWTGTDDASFVERLGEKVYLAEGAYTNIKITTPEDLIYLQALLEVKD